MVLSGRCCLSHALWSQGMRCLFGSVLGTLAAAIGHFEELGGIEELDLIGCVEPGDRA